MIRSLAMAAAACLAACTAAQQEPPPTVPPPPPCPITASSGWVAAVDAMPSPDGSKLVVTGKVTVPGADWQPRWGAIRVLESYPVQVHVDLDADLPPDGISRDPVIKDVRGSWPMRDPVGSVTIMCRGAVLAHIAPVGTVH